jgi:hypothetical protein
MAKYMEYKWLARRGLRFRYRGLRAIGVHHDDYVAGRSSHAVYNGGAQSPRLRFASKWPEIKEIALWTLRRVIGSMYFLQQSREGQAVA